MDNDGKLPIESVKRVTDHVTNEAKSKRRQQLRAEGKKRRRNLKPRPPRSKSWDYELMSNPDDVGSVRHERIMPLDERDRRRDLEMAAFQSLPDSREDIAAKAPGAGGTGMVTSVNAGLCSVALGESIVKCRLRGTLSAQENGFTNAVAVGDNVTVSWDGQNDGIVEDVLQRSTLLTRPDVFHAHLRQLVVANAHQILIVSSWREPILWPELIDRYLIAAQRSELEPLICVTKADLIEDQAEFALTILPYQSLGHRVIRTSTISGEGIEEIRSALRDRMTVLTGLSGTGKSSLLSVVQPGLDLQTRAVAERSGEGRHTTTLATALKLDFGGTVVDTPGVREFGISGLRKHELADFFPEISNLSMRCRFSNCTHLAEPGCAVRTAVEAGGFTKIRYHSYLQIFDTLPR